MARVIGVRFREVGKIYYFDPLEIEVDVGERVIVETNRGMECGRTVLGAREISGSFNREVKPIIRKATAADVAVVEHNVEREKEADQICKAKIIAHGLAMKLISAEYTFDNAKLLFYFTADGRIDFRELVKDLASVFRLRIELRQVGVRDETKMVGGIGSCGRPLCCHSYLSDFVPVSIRMAKEQSLSLNPQKISGVCGRLMCCLKNEADTYAYLNARAPREGDSVVTPQGLKGVVSSVSVLRQRAKVLVNQEGGEKEIVEFALEELKYTPRRGRGRNNEA